MLVWDSKKFGHKIYYRKNNKAEEFIVNWRTWFSKYYQGCEANNKEKDI